DEVEPAAEPSGAAAERPVVLEAVVGAGVLAVGDDRPAGGGDPGRQPGGAGVVEAGQAGPRGFGQEAGAGVLQGGHVAVVVEVVGLDVGQHDGLGGDLDECAVALVGLDHQPFAVVVGGVAADLVGLAADEERRVPAGGPEDERGHRRRRRLAVRPGDGHGAAGVDDGGQRLGPPQHRDAPLPGGPDLGVGGGDGGGDDDGVELGRQAGGVVRDVDVDAEQPQPLQPSPGLEVGAADRVTQPGEDGGDAAHGHPADADDVDAAGNAEI